MQLYLNTRGTYLHVKDNLFEIKIPDEKGGSVKKQLAVHKVKTIVMTTSAALSTDAIQLALQNNIDIVFADYHGFPMGRIWHSKLGSTTKIRKQQLVASMGKVGVQHTVDWLTQKLDNQLDFIKQLKKHRARQAVFLDDKITRIDALRTSMTEAYTAEQVSDVADMLRGLEGTAGRLYFATLSHVLPKQYQFKGRSSRPAEDSFNAFLNYAYGVLYSRVEKALIIAGLDPYVGFLHRDGYNYKSLVYDFIEPYRTHCERVVFKLFSGKKVNQKHCDALANGLKLNKEGKVLLLEQLIKYLDEERVRHRGRNQTRMNILQQEAHQLAAALLQDTNETL